MSFKNLIARTLVLGAMSAVCGPVRAAPIIYQNSGPLNTSGGLFLNNGTADVISISVPIAVAVTAQASSFTFGVHTDPGATIASGEWFLSTGDQGSGTVLRSGTAFPSTDIVDPTYTLGWASFSFPEVALNPGGYFFTLRSATASNGGRVFWDFLGGGEPGTLVQNGVPLSSSIYVNFILYAVPELDGSRLHLPLLFAAVLMMTARRRGAPGESQQHSGQD